MKELKNLKPSALVDKLIDLAQDQAKLVLLNTKRQLIPIFVLIGADGIRFCPCNWGNDAEKEATVNAVRQEIRKHQIFAYSLLTEAWSVVRDSNSWPYQPDERVPDAERPKEQVDRREMVIASAVHRDGVKRVALWWIERDAFGNCSNLREEQSERDAPSTSYGWMDNLFTD